MSKGDSFSRPRRFRRRRSRGQSIVEFAVSMPLLVLAVGGTYTVWSALHQDIGLTNAARAGAISAVQSLNGSLASTSLSFPHPAGVPNPGQMCTAFKQVRSGVAGEEGIPTSQVDVNDTWCGTGQTCSSTDTNICVSMTYAPYMFNATQGIYQVNVTLLQRILPKVSVISAIQVQARASEATK